MSDTHAGARALVFALLAAPLLAGAQPAHAASFDCRKPDLAADEKAICQNPQLNDMDVKMVTTFELLSGLLARAATCRTSRSSGWSSAANARPISTVSLRPMLSAWQSSPAFTKAFSGRSDGAPRNDRLDQNLHLPQERENLSHNLFGDRRTCCTQGFHMSDFDGGQLHRPHDRWGRQACFQMRRDGDVLRPGTVFRRCDHGDPQKALGFANAAI